MQAHHRAHEDTRRAFLRDLVAFYVVFEGMWLHTGFARILSRCLK